METVGNWLTRCRRWLAAMPPLRRAAVIGAAAIVLAGLAWMAWPAPARTVAVFDSQLAPGDLADAQKALASRGIDCTSQSGRLLVPRDRLQEARDILHKEDLLGGESVSLEQLAQKEDVWSSQSQVSRRWQAGKMAAMAGVIRRFPAVRSATVIFEDGGAGSLGAGLGGAVEPTASVGVELKSGCSMTADLVDAIADLVSGGMAGMKRQNVRVVDSAGKSYRAEDSPLAEPPALRQVRAAEDYIGKKVRAAIPAVDGTLLAVRVEQQDGTPAAWLTGGASKEQPQTETPGLRCAEVRVSLPRSYFLGVARASTGQGRPDDSALQSAIAAQQDQLRDMIASALGEKDLSRIRVESHFDALPAAAADVAPIEQHAEASWGRWPLAAAAAIAAIGACAMITAILRRRKGRRRETGEEPSGDGRDGFAGGAIGVLQLASAEDISAILRGEHPQTVAILLSSLPPERAGAALASLPADMQTEVSRRIAAMERIEPRMLREVDRALASRLSEQLRQPRPPAGGRAKLAELLRRAGQEAQTRIIQSLSKELPDLAESLRGKGLAFEDIVAMGDSRLSAVLEGMDSRRVAVALRTASRDMARKVFSCLSAQAARRLRTQIEAVGPVRLSDVESAQQQIVAALQAEEGGLYAAVGNPDSVA